MRYLWHRLVIGTLTVGTGCGLDDRQFSTVDAGEPTQITNPINPDSLTLGSPCTRAETCGTGFCVDGVCCESACDGVCSGCSAEGTCDAVPEDDAACPEVACPASDQCTSYPMTSSEGRCVSLGECRTACEGTSVGEGQLCSLPDVAEARCSAEGQCADSHQGSGNACTVDAECVSAHCVDGVCCAEACDGTCEECTAPAGACVAVAPDAATVTCGEDGRSCFGRGACLLPLGRQCTLGSDCGSGQCVVAVSGSVSLCCDQACPTGQQCSSEGHCVDPVADLGRACETAADCTLGHCVDGVCCDGPCSGVCESCDTAGQEGRCLADSPSTACDSEAPARRCLFRGLCQLPPGQTCASNEDCGSGHCEPAVGGGSVCCAATCQAGVEACTTGANGGVCQVVPRVNGGTCANDAQCISGSCQQSRCCPGDCGGACEVCSVRGQCEVPPAGAEGGCSPINCAAQNTDCRTFGTIGNLCEALGDCKEAADCPSTDVRAGTRCTLGGGAQGACNGNGTCVALPPARLIVDTAQLDLGSATIGTNGGSRPFTLTNVGGLPTGTLQAANPAEFSAAGSCLGSALQPNTPCTIIVTFRPAQPGNRLGTLTLNAGQGVSASVTLTGVGQCGASQTAVTIDGRLQCRLVNGSVCNTNNPQACADGSCRRWYLDVDSDGYGGTTVLDVCGQSDANRPPPVLVTGNRGQIISEPYASFSGDCCDVVQQNAAGNITAPQNVNPANTTPGTPSFCGGARPGDLNCDGVEATIQGVPIGQAQFISCTDPAVVAAHPVCEDRGGFDNPVVCGEVNGFTSCVSQPDGSCQEVSPRNGGPVACL